MSCSDDALRFFNVQPTSGLCRDVRKRLFSLRIWSPRYKHVNSDVKQSFDHSVTVRKSLLCVKLGVMNCQSIGGKLDFVFHHIKEYKLDIVALTGDSKNKHVIDQCVAYGYTLHHSPCTSGRRGGGVGILVNNEIKVTFRQIHVSPQITSFELMEAVLTIYYISLRLIVIYRNICMTKYSHSLYTSTYSYTPHNTNRKHNIHHIPYTKTQPTSTLQG